MNKKLSLVDNRAETTTLLEMLKYVFLFSLCFLLLTSCVSIPRDNQAGRFSHTLNWGINPATQKDWSRSEIRAVIRTNESSLSIELNNLLKSSRKDLENGVVPQAIDKIEKEGTLNVDPRHSASDGALKGTESILKWAICSEVAASPLDRECFEAAYKGAMKWIQVFHPSGNPINDNQLLRLIVALDFLFDGLSKEDQTLTMAWLKEFVANGDSYFASLNGKESANNWMTWRLSIRALASVMTQDQSEILKTKNMIVQHASINLKAPDHWHPDISCENTSKDTSYGSYDFRHRDALHYHIYNLEAWMWIAIFTPDLLSAESNDYIENALQFIQPYYQRKKVHVEFLCSKVKFDSQRKEAGQREFQNQNWDPYNARKLLRMARARFPLIRDWSKDVVDTNYPPWLKLLAVANGDSDL